MQCIDLSRARALTVAVLVILTGCPDGGQPLCPDELSDCSGTCQDLQTDELNCGSCGNACASGQTCEQGQCRTPQPQCSTGQISCNGTCVDTRSNASHCGSCGNVCASGQTCEQSQCRPQQPQCSTGLTSCNGICVNLQTSPSNCGACGITCASGQCSAGQCVPPSSCGDGAITGTESCDDSNATSGDGCSSSCAIEPDWTCQGQPSRCARRELEPNNSRDTATPVPSQPSLFIRGAITPGSDVDIYRLTVTGTADLRLDTFDGTYDGSGSGSCADSIDTLLELLNADGAVLTSDDDGGIERCSSLQPGLTPGVARLPAGTYFLRVRSYNASSIPAYTLRIQFEALCGDGTRQAPEQCDDGNTAGGDACPATCRPEKVPEVENNDTAAMAQALASLPSLIGGAISPGSDSDMFRFTLNATADVEIETYDGSYTGTHIEACQNIDTYLELIAANGTTTIASDDDNGIDNCSSLTPPTSRAMRRMAPGTYFARVTSFWGSELPAYSVAIRYRALCGDGAVTGSEECDGGAGCSATCERTPNCGDGYLDYPEACEDGNTTNGDGCSSTCQIPGLSSEVEPNNTRAEADARATGSSPVLITGTTGISSAFQTYEDVDVYKLQLQSARTVKLETFHGGLGRCTPDLDTVVRLTNASGAQVGSNDDGGPGSCSLLEISLQAGTYYVTVDRVGSEDSESYALQVTFQ